MKELYSFTITKEKEVEKTEQVDGGTLVKKVKEKVPIKVILKKPSRLDMAHAEEVYAVEWSDSVKKGIITKEMLHRIYSDSGGFTSQDDLDKHIALSEEYARLQLELQKLSLKEDPSEEDKAKKTEVENNLIEVITQVQVFQNNQNRIYDNTAEVRARNKAIQWFVLNLTFVDEDGEIKPLFVSKKDEDKAEEYYNLLEDGDDFSRKAIEKSSITWTFWYLGKAESKEDFEYLEKQLNEQ